jgi:hypothetical protein
MIVCPETDNQNFRNHRENSMPIILRAVILLIISNIFMTFAWYAFKKSAPRQMVRRGGGKLERRFF